MYLYVFVFIVITINNQYIVIITFNLQIVESLHLLITFSPVIHIFSFRFAMPCYFLFKFCFVLSIVFFL